MQKATASQVQQWQARLLDDGTGPRTVQLAHINLSQALDVAVKMDLVPCNVVDVGYQPRYRAREMQCCSAEEAQKFLAAADQSIYGPI